MLFPGVGDQPQLGSINLELIAHRHGPWMIAFGGVFPLAVRSKTRTLPPANTAAAAPDQKIVDRVDRGCRFRWRRSVFSCVSGPPRTRLGATFPLAMRSNTRMV